jgi:xanthine dehydrogenase YagS FAD-binding subunit
MAFEYIRPASLEEVFSLLKLPGQVKLLAGGSDLLWQIREHTVSPDRVIDLKGIAALDFIRESADTLEVGALTTLRDLERSAVVRQSFPALAEAAKAVASQKLRNRATIAGNLCQKLKCPYFNQSHINLFMRESLAPCFKRKGRVCHAAVWGNDSAHTIIGKSYCKAPVPSDVAIALAALGASVEFRAENSTRELMVKDLYRADGEPQLEPDEIVTKIGVPRRVKQGNAFVAYKGGPGSFAMVSVAASVGLGETGRICGDPDIYLGGVAQRPYRADNACSFLRAEGLSADMIEEASRFLFSDVEVTNNDVLFKVAKARDLFCEALTKAWKRCGE